MIGGYLHFWYLVQFSKSLGNLEIISQECLSFPWEEDICNMCICFCCLLESISQFLEQSPVVQERYKQVPVRPS